MAENLLGLDRLAEIFAETAAADEERNLTAMLAARGVDAAALAQVAVHSAIDDIRRLAASDEDVDAPRLVQALSASMMLGFCFGIDTAWEYMAGPSGGNRG